METTKNPNQYVFGLDIGTRSIVGTVGYKNKENRFQIVAQIVKEHETRAMEDGQIHDIAKVSEIVNKLKDDMKSATGEDVEEVAVAVAGRSMLTEKGFSKK